jgi:hypothetical protein
MITPKQKLQLANRIMLDRDLSPAARLVGMYIADHLNTERGYAWTPQEMIAADLGINKRSVRRGIAQLGAYFSVNRERRQHEYRMRTPDNLSAITDIDTGHFCTDRGHGCTPKGDTDVPPSTKYPLRHPLSIRAVATATQGKEGKGTSEKATKGTT